MSCGGDFMPQMNKGGKFIFGKSLIRENGEIQIPPQAASEYQIALEGTVYLFTGSKVTGGFCITRKGLLLPSALGHILTENPKLMNYSLRPGEFVKYKGRAYWRVAISSDAKIVLSEEMMKYFDVEPGMQLLAIRSSNIAFTMGAKGPLLEKAAEYDDEIPVF